MGNSRISYRLACSKFHVFSRHCRPATLALLTLLTFGCGAVDDTAVTGALPHAEPRGKRSDLFPDIALRTQHGETVRFHEDLIRDRVVLVNFMYTRCDGI